MTRPDCKPVRPRVTLDLIRLANGVMTAIEAANGANREFAAIGRTDTARRRAFVKGVLEPAEDRARDAEKALLNLMWAIKLPAFTVAGRLFVDARQSIESKAGDSLMNLSVVETESVANLD